MPRKLRILLYEAESEAALARHRHALPDGGTERFTEPKPLELADGAQPVGGGITIHVHTIDDPEALRDVVESLRHHLTGTALLAAVREHE